MLEEGRGVFFIIEALHARRWLRFRDCLLDRQQVKVICIVYARRYCLAYSLPMKMTPLPSKRAIDTVPQGFESLGIWQVLGRPDLR